MKLLGVLLVSALGLYLALLGLLWWGQERLLFHPAPLAATHRFNQPADVHEVAVEVPGAQLSALHLRLPAPRGLVFFLHGNAGNLDSWFDDAALFRQAGFDVFMIDYRGYGKSSGRIQSQAQLQADVRAAWAQVAPRYAGQPVVLLGRSLGTALAADLAAELQPALTVLVSPYRSMTALAGELYPWVPAALLRYPLDTGAALTRVRTSVLLLHGEADALIPADHSRQLAALSPQAQLVLLPRAGHNDIQDDPGYGAALRAALAGLPAAAAPVMP